MRKRLRQLGLIVGDLKGKKHDSPSMVPVMMLCQRKPFGENGRRRVRRLWLIAGDSKGKKHDYALFTSSGADDGAIDKHV